MVRRGWRDRRNTERVWKLVIFLSLSLSFSFSLHFSSFFLSLLKILLFNFVQHKGFRGLFGGEYLNTKIYDSFFIQIL